MNEGRSLTRPVLGTVSLCLIGSAALAHHSSRGIYDTNAVTEIDGYVEEVTWANPHVRFKVRGRSDDGREALWDVEGASVAFMERNGISRDALNIGDRVRVAGSPSVRNLPAMYGTNILLPDGREVFTLPRAEARWSNRVVDLSQYTFSEQEIEEARRNAKGIFRVWSRPTGGLWNDSYPLTAAAAAARENWDVTKSPYVSCVKGMPSIMEQPYPMEFVERDGFIELHIEEYDVVRRIDMNPNAVVDDLPPATWGHSVGRWDDDTLVVTTKRVSWEYFDQTGIPLTENAVFIERFTPSADGSRLDYEVTVTDPDVFTAPVVLDRSWNWNPGERVKPFNCVTQ